MPDPFFQWIHVWSVGWTILLFACSGWYGRDVQPVQPVQIVQSQTEVTEYADSTSNETPDTDIDETQFPTLDESYAEIHKNPPLRWTTPASCSDPCTRQDPPTWRNGWTENMGGWCRNVHQYFDGQAIYHCTRSYSRMSLYYLRTYGTAYGRNKESCFSIRLWETSVKKIVAEEITRLEIFKQSKGLFDDCHESCRRFNGEVFVGLVISIQGLPIKSTVWGTDNRAILDCVEQKARSMIFSSNTTQSASLAVSFISRTYEEAEAQIVKTGPSENTKDDKNTCKDLNRQN